MAYLNEAGLKQAFTEIDNRYRSTFKAKGIIDATSTSAPDFSKMKDNEVWVYVIASGSSVSGGSVTFSSALALSLFGTANSVGASLGDLLLVLNYNGTKICHVLPLNDAKAASGSFPGADGLETVWDKTQINKIPSIQNSVAGIENREAKTRTTSNMNEALDSGFYPYCNLGRPAGSGDGAWYTLRTWKSKDVDSNKFYTIEQLALCRGGDYYGRVYYRQIYHNSEDSSKDVFMDWVLLSNSEEIVKRVTAKKEGSNNNYPYHRFAYTTIATSSSDERKTGLFLIRGTNNYNQAGIFKLVADNITCARSGWIIKGSDTVPEIDGITYINNGNVYHSVILKNTTADSYEIIRLTSDDNSWTMVDSSEAADTTSEDKTTSVEVYQSTDDVATAVYNAANYRYTVRPLTSVIGIVNTATNATTASKTSKALTVKLNSGTTEGTDMFTFDGSAAKTVNITKSSIGLGNVDNTADADKSVKYATSAGSAANVTGTVAVNHGGTGKTTLTSGEVLVGNGTNAVTSKAIKSSTGVGDIGWGTTADNSKLVDVSAIAYWNGAYSGSTSNLMYFKQGAFGNLATKSTNSNTAQYLRGDGNWSAVNQASTLDHTVKPNTNTSNLMYFQGQPLITDTPSNNTIGYAYKGSSGDYRVWSFPDGATQTGKNADGNSIANVQVLRLGWGTTYFHDLFVSPNNRGIWHREVANGAVASDWRKLAYIDSDITGNAATASNASKVNGHTVNADVPSGAKFTDTTYTSLPNPKALNITIGSTSFGAYNGSVEKSVTVKAGDNITLGTTVDNTTGTGTVTITAKDTTYSVASTTANGLMSSTDKSNLDSHISSTSNPHGVTKYQLGYGSGGSSMGYNTLSVGLADSDNKKDGALKITATDGFGVAFNSGTSSNQKDSYASLDATIPVATENSSGLMTGTDKVKLNGIAAGANNYSLPAATASVLGGVKIGDNITNSNGTISLTKANVTAALGYTPPTTNTTYSNATTSKAGLMSADDKTKLETYPKAYIQTNMYPTVTSNSSSQVVINITSQQPAVLPAYTYIKYIYLYSPAGALLAHGATSTSNSSQDVTVTFSTTQSAAATASGARIVACGNFIGSSSSPRPVVAEWIVQ